MLKGKKLFVCIVPCIYGLIFLCWAVGMELMGFLFSFFFGASLPDVALLGITIGSMLLPPALLIWGTNRTIQQIKLKIGVSFQSLFYCIAFSLSFFLLYEEARFTKEFLTPLFFRGIIASFNSEPFLDTTKGEGLLIAHGGGNIHGYNYTNSKEALEASLDHGYDLIELDLRKTMDGNIFAVHEWQDFSLNSDCHNGQNLPLRELMQCRVNGRYHPLDAQEINTALRSNPKLFIVTDKIRDFSLLLRSIPFPSRLLVEVFSVKDYLRACQQGILYPMLCLDGVEDLRNFDRFLKKGTISIVTMPVELLLKAEEDCRKIHERGVNIFVFTTNDPQLISIHLGKNVSGFYTDSITPESFSEKSALDRDHHSSALR